MRASLLQAEGEHNCSPSSASRLHSANFKQHGYTLQKAWQRPCLTETPCIDALMTCSDVDDSRIG